MNYVLQKLLSLIPPEERICVVCKCQLTTEITDLHHKDGKRWNNKPENLMLICQTCHRGHITPRKQDSILISVKLPTNLLEKISNEAEITFSNTSAIIRKILLEHYDRTNRIEKA